MLRALSHVVPRSDLYLSRSPKDARRIARTILSRGYDTVFCGGGDGTFIGFADEILCEAERAHATAPRFGVLKLGTGNGLAALVHASPLRDGGVVDDVRRACEGAVPGYRPLELLKVDGRRAQFAGLGVDARLLNDYLDLKSRVHGTWGHWALTGARGYALTVGLRTLPYVLTHRLSSEVEVRNVADVPAYRLDSSGRTVGEVAPGEVLYRGPAMLVAAGTIPFYGYALRMFPFAGQRKGYLQLRLGTVNPLAAVANVRSLWRGEWFPRHHPRLPRRGGERAGRSADAPADRRRRSRRAHLGRVPDVEQAARAGRLVAAGLRLKPAAEGARRGRRPARCVRSS